MRRFSTLLALAFVLAHGDSTAAVFSDAGRTGDDPGRITLGGDFEGGTVFTSALGDELPAADVDVLFQTPAFEAEIPGSRPVASVTLADDLSDLARRRAMRASMALSGDRPSVLDTLLLLGAPLLFPIVWGRRVRGSQSWIEGSSGRLA